MFEALFGTEMPPVIRLSLVFLIVLGLISGAAWALSRSGRGRLASANGRQLRLAVIDSASFEGSRRLILIRRNNVEHLLMIGGPTDVVVEANILHAAGAPLEAPVTRPPVAAEPLARADKGSRPLPPEPLAIPRPAPQVKPPAPPFKPVSQELRAGQLLAQSEPSTRLQRDALAALANELSTRPPAPPKDSATLTRSHPIEPRLEPRSEPGEELETGPVAEPRTEPGLKNQPEPRVETQPDPPLPAQTAATETASTADEDLAKLARLLEAKLRKPNVPEDARPPAAPARVAPPPQRALAAETLPAPPSPVRARSPSEPKPPSTDAKSSQGTMPSDSLEQQLASLLGRSTKN